MTYIVLGIENTAEMERDVLSALMGLNKWVLIDINEIIIEISLQWKCWQRKVDGALRHSTERMNSNGEVILMTEIYMEQKLRRWFCRVRAHCGTQDTLNGTVTQGTVPGPCRCCTYKDRDSIYPPAFMITRRHMSAMSRTIACWSTKNMQLTLWQANEGLEFSSSEHLRICN